jgi:hypothetical protein
VLERAAEIARRVELGAEPEVQIGFVGDIVGTGRVRRQPEHETQPPCEDPEPVAHA